MTVTQRYFHPVSVIALLVAAWVANSRIAGANDGESPQSQPSSAQIGIGGNYRPGYWTGVRLPQGAVVDGRVHGVETLDNDGVGVRYQQPQSASQAAAAGQLPWSYIVAGAAASPLQLYGEHEKLLWQGRLTGNALAPATPWVVVIGDALGLETIGRSALLGRESSVAVTQIDAANALPDQAVGWDGVDLLIINASGAGILSELNQRQIAAVADWISGGGRLFLSLGREGAALLSQSRWLAELAGLPVDAELIRLDPAALETYTSSQSPLSPLDGYPLPPQGGRTVVSGRTTARSRLGWWSSNWWVWGE